MNGGLVLIFNNIQEINFQLSFFFAFSFPFEIGSLVAGICKEQKKNTFIDFSLLILPWI